MSWSCHGVPTGILTHPDRDNLTRLFWSHVDRWFDTDGCWVWSGATSQRGYGCFKVLKPDGKRANRYAHRIAWELGTGHPVAEGMVLDHICRNPKCVRPSHLREVTQAQNLHAPGSQAVAKKKAEQTHCQHGHEFSIVAKASTRRGFQRLCLTCDKNRRAMKHAASTTTTDNDKETDR